MISNIITHCIINNNTLPQQICHEPHHVCFHFTQFAAEDRIKHETWGYNVKCALSESITYSFTALSNPDIEHYYICYWINYHYIILLLLFTVEPYNLTADNMEKTTFNYSMKNIPVPPRKTYLMQLIAKVESVIKRMRWKAFFFQENETNVTEDTNSTEENYGFKSRNCPPQINELEGFESDLIKMTKNIKFRHVNDKFQRQLKEDIRKIKTSSKAFIPADKTRNFYEIDIEQHEKLLHDNITAAYKKTDKNTVNQINKEAKCIAKELKIDNRTETIAEQEAFITLKDHKENFEQNPKCRLINPAKSEIGIVSKKILEKIIVKVKEKTNVNQWRNSSSVIEWFKELKNKQTSSFLTFDIENFYPTISENLLIKAINFAKTLTPISEGEYKIIMHARKSVLFNSESAWQKKNNPNLFDVTMGSFDGAEVCELVGLLILEKLGKIFGKNNVGLYRDDGLALLTKKSGPQIERYRKKLTKAFKELDLKITIQTSLKTTNFLDFTLNLNNNTYKPYRKPNDKPLYINTNSNHPQTILKHIPDAINKRISNLSSNNCIFEKSKEEYEEALKASGYEPKLSYNPPRDTRPSTRAKKRSRKIIWFNPPFNKSVKNNIGRIFLNLIKKHFPKSHRLSKIFNQNNIKVSYCCTSNMGTIIKNHNKKVTKKENKNTNENVSCNCRTKEACPFNNKCLSKCLIYNARVTTANDTEGKNYIGLTEGTFKARYTQHTSTFRHRKHASSTQLSKYVWELKDKGIDHEIEWTSLATGRPYSSVSKRCHLCLVEKYNIICSKKDLLNRKSELISKCRHENKFYLANFKESIT